jgi:Carboxypeptidase regulatory-like domain/TonB-dependent Receptor Plug Domain
MRKTLLLALVTVFSVCVTLPVAAQKYTGTIRGTVSDPSGAMMPGAEVSIKNLGTGEVRTVATNAEGEFVALEMPVGNYDIVVKKAGFKEFVSKGVELHVSTTYTVNAALQVGNASEQVTVEANPVQVETATGAVGNVIEGNEVRELPLNGRSFVQLTQLMPGVSAASNFDTKHKGLEAGVDFSVNGNNTTNNLFLVDGVNNNDIGSNRTILVYPSIDAISEFKILRNSYGPEYGQASGAIVNIVTRGGTNQFHGGAFYFGRNDVMNAADYFNNLNGIKKDVLRRNDFGYNIGGPVFKDKLFFFWSQEWNRELRGKARVGDVPTAAEKAGDFSNPRPDLANDGSACDPKVFDPSNPAVQWTNINQAPAGQDGYVLSKGGSPYLAMLPDPNVANPVNCKNWAQSLTAPIYWREENVRVDYKIASTWSLMGRFTQDHWEQPFPSTLGFWGEDPYPSIESSWKQPGYQATIKLTKLLGSTAVNDFQISYASNRITVDRAGTNPGLNDTINSNAPPFFGFATKFQGTKIGYPGFWGGIGANAATGDNLWTQAPWHNNEQLFIFKDDFSKVMGTHTFKVGFLATNNQKNELVNNESQENAFYGSAKWSCPAGTCDPTATSGPTAPKGVTSNGAFNMLWDGIAWNGGELQTNPFSQIRWHDFETYFGDSWKIRRNVTLEYGIRWSFLRMPYSGPDRIATFEASAYNPALGNDPCNGLVLPPGTNFCADAGFSPGVHADSRALKEQNNHAIAPRLGVAWDPRGDGKMSIRAGVGQFFQRERLNNTLQMATNPPFSLSASYNRTFDTPPGPGTITASGTPGFSQDPGSDLPNTWQWNLTVEREIVRNSKLELAYVGNRGIHLLTYTDANRVPAADRLAFALSNAGALRPFGAGSWGAINEAFWGGDSNYHALQVLFRSKFTRSLDAQFAYTWSKSLSNADITNSGNVNQTSLLLDPANPRLNYGPSQINRPHIFTANIVYSLPSLIGQNGFLKAAAGGWEMATILNYTSGPSMTTYAQNGLDIGGGNTGGIAGTGTNQTNVRPLLVAGQGCRAPSGSPKFQWLNPNRYTLTGYQVGTFGSAGVGDCSGPGIANTDFSVYKNFKLTERLGLQFRMEFYNLFNTTQFLGNAQGFVGVNNVLNTGNASVCNTQNVNNANNPCFGQPVGPGNVIGAFTRDPNYGTASKDRGPREIQYALKFTF